MQFKLHYSSLERTFEHAVPSSDVPQKLWNNALILVTWLALMVSIKHNKDEDERNYYNKVVSFEQYEGHCLSKTVSFILFVFLSSSSAHIMNSVIFCVGVCRSIYSDSKINNTSFVSKGGIL